jgi:transcriptional regulator with XRE-family HTH domain
MPGTSTTASATTASGNSQGGGNTCLPWREAWQQETHICYEFSVRMSLAEKGALRRVALRALLTDARSRLKPHDVGLPAAGFRRVPGLRQAEVAELAGVSTRWYEHFEDGRPDRRFSIGFVERVANALCLSGKERSMLFRLALPEVRAAVEQVERNEHDGALWGLTRTCDFVRRLMTVSSFDEAAQVAAETVRHPFTIVRCERRSLTQPSASDHRVRTTVRSRQFGVR